MIDSAFRFAMRGALEPRGMLQARCQSLSESWLMIASQLFLCAHSMVCAQRRDFSASLEKFQPARMRGFGGSCGLHSFDPACSSSAECISAHRRGKGHILRIMLIRCRETMIIRMTECYLLSSLLSQISLVKIQANLRPRRKTGCAPRALVRQGRHGVMGVRGREAVDERVNLYSQVGCIDRLGDTWFLTGNRGR